MRKGLRYTIEDLKTYAESRGGKCLSLRYETLPKKYKWECAKGHVWFATASSTLVRGHWCPECAGHGGRHIHEMKIHSIAKEWGGAVLSQKYDARHLRFRCMRGHEFELSADRLVKGRWCSRCKTLARAASYAWMTAKMAEFHGGNILTPLEDIRKIVDVVACKCKNGHEFHASVANIIHRKSWCPQCSTERRLRTRAQTSAMKSPQSVSKQNSTS